MTLDIPRVYGHSYFFTMHTSLPVPTPDGGLTAGCQFDGGPRCGSIALDKGASSDWVDVGVYMDVFNHGTWNFGPGSRAGGDPGMYTIQVGVKKQTQGTGPGTEEQQEVEVEPIGPPFVSAGEGVQIVFDASTRATRRVRSEASDFFELAAALDLQTPKMPPNRFGPSDFNTRLAKGTRSPWDMNVQVYGTFFTPTPSGGGFASTSCPKCGAEYTAAWTRVNDMFGISLNGFWGPECESGSGQCEWDSANTKAYVDVRDALTSPATLATKISLLQNTTNPENIYVVSLGDEVSVSVTDLTAISAANFTAYCQQMNVSAADGCGGGANVTASIAEAAGDRLTNGKWYHSQKFVHAAAIQHFKNMTTQLKAGFPNANIGERKNVLL